LAQEIENRLTDEPQWVEPWFSTIIMFHASPISIHGMYLLILYDFIPL
jgi:hypothetical protein